MKYDTLIDYTLRPYASSMPGNDTAYDGESDPGVLEFALRVQALKSPKQLVGARRVEAGPVVAHEKDR